MTSLKLLPILVLLACCSHPNPPTISNSQHAAIPSGIVENAYPYRDMCRYVTNDTVIYCRYIPFDSTYYLNIMTKYKLDTYNRFHTIVCSNHIPIEQTLIFMNADDTLNVETQVVKDSIFIVEIDRNIPKYFTWTARKSSSIPLYEIHQLNTVTTLNGNSIYYDRDGVCFCKVRCERQNCDTAYFVKGFKLNDETNYHFPQDVNIFPEYYLPYSKL